MGTEADVSARDVFILRRAAWVGAVTRRDLVEAFGISAPQATKDLAAVIKKYPDVLERQRERGGVGLKIGAPVPEEASATRILELFRHGGSLRETGLHAHELEVLVCPGKPYVLPEPALSVLLKAAVGGHPLQIGYTGLRKGESMRLRRVLPMMLEFTGKKWRFTAFDLDMDEPEEKTFVMARVTEVHFVPHSRPLAAKVKKLLECWRTRGDSKNFEVILNENLTADQRVVVERELGVRGSMVMLNERDAFEFRRLYCDERPGREVVWPVIVSIKQK